MIPIESWYYTLNHISTNSKYKEGGLSSARFKFSPIKMHNLLYCFPIAREQLQPESRLLYQQYDSKQQRPNYYLLDMMWNN